MRRREEEQAGIRFPPQECDTEDVLSPMNGEFSGDRDKQLAVITGVPKQGGSRPVLSTHQDLDTLLHASYAEETQAPGNIGHTPVCQEDALFSVPIQYDVKEMSTMQNHATCSSTPIEDHPQAHSGMWKRLGRPKTSPNSDVVHGTVGKGLKRRYQPTETVKTKTDNVRSKRVKVSSSDPLSIMAEAVSQPRRTQ